MVLSSACEAFSFRISALCLSLAKTMSLARQGYNVSGKGAVHFNETIGLWLSILSCNHETEGETQVGRPMYVSNAVYN